MRSNAFTKLLTHVSEQDCSKQRIAPLAQKLMSEMSETAPDLLEQGDRIEIMPFEHLWDEMQPLLEE